MGSDQKNPPYFNNFTPMFYKTGPYNQSGEWKGVMGDVVSGKHSVSLSAWSWFIERDSFLDFVPVVKDRQILAVIPRPPEVDPGLFIRYKMCQSSTQLLCETQVKSKIWQILSNSLDELNYPNF